MAGGSCTDVKDGKYRFQAYEYRNRRIPLVVEFQDKEGDLPLTGYFLSSPTGVRMWMSLIYRAGSLL
ncbi:hypothetical protein O5823_13145 [Escherichia coli]|nr:hypothetical protein [Escherichia coli]